jgi:hypothetical protein
VHRHLKNKKTNRFANFPTFLSLKFRFSRQLSSKIPEKTARNRRKTGFGWAKSVDFKTRIVPHSTKCRENGGKCTCIGELFPDVPADRVRRILFLFVYYVFISVLRARCFFFFEAFRQKMTDFY